MRTENTENTEVKRNDMVVITDSSSNKYGQVVSVDNHWRGGLSYEIRYIDPNTGKLFQCPDTRCKDGCVICSTTKFRYQLHKIDKDEIIDFIRAKMIDISIVPS